jgi:diguanylate cyclase (GGDEF)-like protein
MEGNPTWLCPTQFDRARMLDMESKLQPARLIMYGSLAIVFLIGVPWVGPWILLPLAASVVFYAGLKPFIAKSARPEYALAATVVVSQALIGVAIALTGGPQSCAIPILLLPVVTLPARFPTRGVLAGVTVTIAILLAATIGSDPAAFADNPTYTLVALAAIFGLAAFAHTLMSSEIQQRADATIDPLTGLLNRKALTARFAEISEQAAISGDWVAIIECDLDSFKRINDLYGHDRGDAVLAEAAHALRRNLRSFELAYRLGGEEFLIVLPGAGIAEGRAAAQRIRTEIERTKPGGLSITASLGVAAARGSAVRFAELFRRADAALYEAKRGGRNQVVVAGSLHEAKAATPIVRNPSSLQAPPVRHRG